MDGYGGGDEHWPTAGGPWAGTEHLLRAACQCHPIARLHLNLCLGSGLGVLGEDRIDHFGEELVDLLRGSADKT